MAFFIYIFFNYYLETRFDRKYKKKLETVGQGTVHIWKIRAGREIKRMAMVMAK